jgi:hypothetical protein
LNAVRHSTTENVGESSRGSGQRTQLSIFLAATCGEVALQAPDRLRPAASEDTASDETPASDTASPPAELTIGAILDRAPELGFGLVAAILALASVPLVGLTVPFGLAVAALGVQMIAGASRPWLPELIRRRSISLAMIQAIHERTARWGARMARVVHPRMLWLTNPALKTFCGAGLLIQGLSLMLPIPGADWLFVIPIVLYGVGLMERDGLLILACHTLTLAQVVLGFVLWEMVASGFADAYRWSARVVGGA